MGVKSSDDTPKFFLFLCGLKLEQRDCKQTPNVKARMVLEPSLISRLSNRGQSNQSRYENTRAALSSATYST
jgi:hypothetical protein